MSTGLCFSIRFYGGTTCRVGSLNAARARPQREAWSRGGTRPNGWVQWCQTGAEWPAHSLYFMSTKWIDLWAVCVAVAQAWQAADPLSLTQLTYWVEPAIWQPEQLVNSRDWLELFRLGWTWFSWQGGAVKCRKQSASRCFDSHCSDNSVTSRVDRTLQEQVRTRLSLPPRVALLSCDQSRSWLTPVVMVILSDKPQVDSSRWKSERKAEKQEGRGRRQRPRLFSSRKSNCLLRKVTMI